MRYKLHSQKKYMFKTIYDSLTREKLWIFEKDTDVLANGFTERHNMASVSVRRIEKKFKEYLKKEIKYVGQTFLIADIIEKRQGVNVNEKVYHSLTN